MLNFTSALYLGLQHPSASLRPWRQFTTGVPAALGEAPLVHPITQALAELTGAEAATLGASTLHLAWDLFGLLAEKPITLFMDAKVYPITRWGAQRAAMRGAGVREFPHHDVAGLEQAMVSAPPGRVPVIVTDGFCPNCGRAAPLDQYLALVRRQRGLLVVDDTQALGILGHTPTATHPYGRGGGGTARWNGISGPEVLVLASLAKGFGVPLAVLAGSCDQIRKFEETSLTRVHCSPPSVPVLCAAEHALTHQRRHGEKRRQRLLALVHRFRRGLRSHGVVTGSGWFPVQTIRGAPGISIPALHRQMAKQGLRTVLNRGENGSPQISVLINSGHSPAEIDAAVSVTAGSARTARTAPARSPAPDPGPPPVTFPESLFEPDPAI